MKKVLAPLVSTVTAEPARVPSSRAHRERPTSRLGLPSSCGRLRVASRPRACCLKDSREGQGGPLRAYAINDLNTMQQPFYAPHCGGVHSHCAAHVMILQDSSVGANFHTVLIVSTYSWPVSDSVPTCSTIQDCRTARGTVSVGCKSMQIIRANPCKQAQISINVRKSM